MRKICAICLVGLHLGISCFANEKPLMTSETQRNLWVHAWTKADKSLDKRLHQERGNLLQVISHYILYPEGAYAILLMREEPNSKLGKAVTDLSKRFSGVLRELSYRDFLNELAMENQMVMHRGATLSESGNSFPLMKDALYRWLEQFDVAVQDVSSSVYAHGITILRVNLNELGLASQPSSEFRLLIQYLMDMAVIHNAINLRVVISATPAAWNFVWQNESLREPFHELSQKEALIVVDGSRLDVSMDCASLLQTVH